MPAEQSQCTAYLLDDPSNVLTPSIAVYPPMIRANIATAVRLAGGADRLRPHVKTHKTRELTQLEIERGITKHKCATIAEAELLAESGVTDIVLAYALVGPNIGRFARLQERYPHARIRPLVDHPFPLKVLGEIMRARNQTAEVLLDLDVGMGRTGMATGRPAIELYATIHQTIGLVTGGLHVYDGQNHQHDPAERQAAVESVWRQVQSVLTELDAVGLPVPRLVCGNTPTAPCWAKLSGQDARIECSPGTLFLNDWNYFRTFPDVDCPPAACLLTRVVSKPRPGRLTLDLGYKAVASDPPMDRRVKFLNLPDATIVLQNEEHLVVETAEWDRWTPGDLLYAWPAHICPSCALHHELLVVENRRVVGTWSVIGRDRVLHC